MITPTKIIDYVMDTPNNTNKKVLSDLFDGFASETVEEFNTTLNDIYEHLPREGMVYSINNTAADDNGNVEVPLDSPLYIKEIAQKNIFHGVWVPGAYSNTGVWLDGVNTGTNIGVKEKFEVRPNTTYCISHKNKLTTCTYSSVYAVQYDEEMNFLSILKNIINLHAQTQRTFTTGSNTAYIALYVYGEGRTGLATDSYAPTDLMVEVGAAATEYQEYKPVEAISVDTVELHTVLNNYQQKLDNFEVPDYYFVNNYLTNKITTIRTYLNQAIGDGGTAFFFITDEHWEKNAKRSIALMKYLADELNIHLAFSGGDSGEGASEEFARQIEKAVGEVHFIMGNHDYFNNMNGHKLAYMHDIGKNTQISGAIPAKHYYSVNDWQSGYCYVVLNSYNNDGGTLGSGYTAEQTEWLRGLLETEEKTIIFTHSLYYGFGPTANFAPSPTGADGVIEVIDNAINTPSLVIQGHAHLDKVVATTSGVPVVTTTCDKYEPWIEGGTNQEPWLSNRVKNTITEQAFDVVVVNPVSKKAYFVRIGAAAANAEVREVDIK